MESHQKIKLSNLVTTPSRSAATAAITRTWLHGDETEQVLSQLSSPEQKIVHSFLNQLADKEKIKSPTSCHKFFDPMAGP